MFSKSQLIIVLIIVLSYSKAARAQTGGDDDESDLPAGAGVANDQPNSGTTNLPPPDNVKFIMVAFRNCNRNPTQLMKDFKYNDQLVKEAAGQTVGRRGAIAFGDFLRKRYNFLIPAEFTGTKVQAYSSSSDRCQESLQAVMVGLYPFDWKSGQFWQPVPYQVNEAWLSMFKLMQNGQCPGLTPAFQGATGDSSKPVYDLLNKNPEFVYYISQQSGLNASITGMSDIAASIGNVDLLNLQQPDWVTKPTLANAPKDTYGAIMAFADPKQSLCANDSACSRLVAGNWLDSIIKTLNKVKEGKLKKGAAATIYATHMENVFSLIRLLKADDVTTVPTAGGFVFEYTDKPAPGVRFIFAEPDAKNFAVKATVKTFAYCRGKDWCPLDTFIENVKDVAFSDWQAACKANNTAA